MRWLLVEPVANDDIRKTLDLNGIPSGAYLAPVLEEEGETVRIEDAPTLGHDLKDINEKIEEFDPDFVGISAMTPTIDSAYQVAKIAKKGKRERKVILGGPHPTLLPERTMEECSHIDILAIGEGENTIREIAKGKDLFDIKGIIYRENDDIIKNDPRPTIMDLDSLPFPAYHLLPMKEYEAGGKRYATMMTSRGCPFNCTFCASSEICGKTWRGKSPERVIEQIKSLRNEYGVKEIEMIDDTFTLDKERVIKICEYIIEENLDISWGCSSRVDTIDEEIARKLKEAGCHTIYLGIESGTQEMLDRLKKGTTIEQIKKTMGYLKKTGFKTLGSFILGIPGETKEQVEKTIRFAKELDPTLAQFTIFTPYPGTEAYEDIRDDESEDWSKFSTLNPVAEHNNLDYPSLKKTLHRAYLGFYLRPSYLIKAARKGLLWTVVKSGMRSLKSYGIK